MKPIRTILLLAGLVLGTVINAQKTEVYAPDGLALNGYDVVAFFTKAQAIKGDPQYTQQWKDVSWQFSSKANLDSFAANPEKYAPQYGGYCAFGASRGYKAPTETDTWTIDNNKLYFNYNQQVKKAWDKDRPKLIAEADRKWPGFKDK